MTGWSVTYETATVRKGEARSRVEAEHAARLAHDALVCAGLDPNKLAYHVEETVLNKRRSAGGS